MGFVHPGILIGCLAVSVPILLHFIRSRKYQRVELGTLRFLRIAIQERRRWRHIENWPLLLARIGLILLVTLLFARPFFPAREKIAPGELEAILLVDGSGSVSGANFEAVRAAVRETLAKVPPGAKITLASFADDVKISEGAGVEQLQAVASARTDYLRTINWTLDHVAQSDRRYAHVYLMSDLQQSALPSTPPRVWPANVHATVVPVPARGPWNAGISRVELLTPYAEAEAAVEVTVLVSGPAPPVEREVRLEIAGRPVQTQTVGAAGGRLRFHWPPGPDLVFTGTVSVASTDPYPEDNARPFAVRLAQPKRVLMAEGSAPASTFDSDAYFLNKALSVSGREHGPSPFATSYLKDLNTIPPAQALVLCDLAGVPDLAAQTLGGYVRSGGSLAILLGKNAQLEQFAALAKEDCFPTQITRVAAPAPYAIESWDRAHPALALFDGRERGDLRSIVLRDAFAIEPGTDWRVLAKLENGHPVLLAREVGQGRVLVFANPLTRAWSELPRERIFLPLIKEWFAWLTRLDADPGAPTEVAPGFQETRAPGVYRDGEKIQVVAPDAAEMNVAVATSEVARRALALPAEEGTAMVREDAGLPSTRERQNEIWPWLALGILALLWFENRLADRRPKRHVQPN